MMGASAISGICNLAPPNLPYHRDRDPARKASVREHDALLSRMLKHGRSFETTHHPEHANPNPRVCSCGTETASTSGQSTRQVSFPAVRCRDASTKFSKQRLHQRERQASEKWDTDLHGDVPESTRRRQKRRAALAALALAGYVSSAALAAEALVLIDSPAPTMTVAAHGIQIQRQDGIQIQRQEWELPIASAPILAPNFTREIASAPPVQDLEDDVFYAWKQVQKELVWGQQQQREVGCVPEDDSFSAWRGIEKEMGFEGVESVEDDPFYAWRGIQKEMAPVPKSPVKKAVAASAAVAVAVAGSVAGAASAAGRAVASSGGTTVVATSLTVLHHSALPGSTLLVKIAQHLGGGGVAGAIGATAVYPLDTIKTRMQAQSLEGEEPQYKDAIDCFRQLVTKEGPASLYSGLVPQLLGIAPEKAMKLTVNEALLSSLETMMPGARMWALEFIAGGGGGASQVVFTNPMEIVKVRLQTQRDGAPKKELWTIVKELGVKGLYDGAGVTLARDVPSSAIFFAVYTLLRGFYPDQSFLAGAIAAIPATVLVTPMDIIKTRLQKEPAPGEQQYTDWWECLQDIVNKEGPQALFKGSLLRVLRTSPQFGITLMLYGILCGDVS